MCRDGGQRRRPPAGQEQKPGTDRAIEPREPQIRTQPGWREGVDPIAGRIGDRTGRPAHRASGLPVKVSNVPRPVLVFFSVSTFGALIASLKVGAFGFGSSVQATVRNFIDFS